MPPSVYPISARKLGSRAATCDRVRRWIYDRVSSRTPVEPVSSARLRSVMSMTKTTPSSCFLSKIAPPTSTGTRLPSLRKNSFSKGCKSRSRSSGLTPGGRRGPLGGRQLRPMYPTRDKVFMAVAHHVEKGFVGFDDPAINSPCHDANDIGLDQSVDTASHRPENPR